MINRCQLYCPEPFNSPAFFLPSNRCQPGFLPGFQNFRRCAEEETDRERCARVLVLNHGGRLYHYGRTAFDEEAGRVVPVHNRKRFV